MSWKSGTSAADSEQQALELPVERLARGGPRSPTRASSRSRSASGEENQLRSSAGARVEQRVGEVVGVVVVGVPAPDQEVEARVAPARTSR